MQDLPSQTVPAPLFPERRVLRREADPANISSRMIGDLHGYWLHKHRDGVLPSRAQIDPTDIPHLLPNILLGNIEFDPFRVFYRLAGTRITAFRGEITGRYLDAITWFEPATRRTTQDIYEMIARSRQPTFAEVEIRSISGTPYRIQTGLWPLANRPHGPADMFIALEDYGALERVQLDL